MDYYKRLDGMYKDCEKVLKAKGDGGAVEESLVFELMRAYGLGEKTIIKHLDRLERLGKLSRLDDTVFWKGE